MKYIEIVYKYLKDRFTKELFSTYGGLLIIVLYAMGYIDNGQYELLSEIAEYMGWTMPVIGSALIATPTSTINLKQ